MARQIKARKHIERDQRHVSRIVSTAWKELDDDAKKYWYDRAAVVKKCHEAKHPGYKFSPRARSEKPKKRNVKRNGPQDKERSRTLGKILARGADMEQLETEALKFDATMTNTSDVGVVETTYDCIPPSQSFATGVFDSMSWQPSSIISPIDTEPWLSLPALQDPLLPPLSDGVFVPQDGLSATDLETAFSQLGFNNTLSAGDGSAPLMLAQDIRPEAEMQRIMDSFNNFSPASDLPLMASNALASQSMHQQIVDMASACRHTSRLLDSPLDISPLETNALGTNLPQFDALQWERLGFGQTNESNVASFAETMFSFDSSTLFGEPSFAPEPLIDISTWN
ncbi:predicted protein [Postia placenta Mad-698-R]|uniref:HMG box domain-containing protein n=1 Tax=Postia placenta MAD-698-R-SB12 TaxID=670580 RepID=A0A1X6NHF0_9APHY|nr:hypothetical protein POSPLADRAFT_1043055 [Postia placenta MAD-698-R-SB12]EED82909.1 predicted protein [Postia placenta Mad-698-R]OSX67866.1 hypothetical protein POSPLADRAFT_1043055 [Postia placenta MAD-698-R-SB12]